MGIIKEEEKWLNENYSKTPVTEEQKRVAEKYKNVKMNLRFTPDGESWSIWHGGQLYCIGYVSHIEPDVLDKTQINCLINGNPDTLFAKPQDEEQEFYFERYHYLKDQIYFCNYSGSLPCILSKRNELQQILDESVLYEPINPDWEDSDIIINRDSFDYPYSTPFSYEQQRINLEFNNYGCNLFFSANGERSFIYTSNKKICEIIGEKEAIEKGLDMDECCDYGNGYIITEIEETDIHYKSIQEIVGEINSF